MSTDIQQAAIALTQAAEAYRRAAMDRLASASIDELHTMAAASAAEAITNGAVRVRGPARKTTAKKAAKAVAAETEESPHRNPVRPPRGYESTKTAILGALANGELSSEQIQAAARIDRATSKKALAKMRQDNVIGMRGERRSAKYFIRK